MKNSFRCFINGDVIFDISEQRVLLSKIGVYEQHIPLTKIGVCEINVNPKWFTSVVFGEHRFECEEALIREDFNHSEIARNYYIDSRRYYQKFFVSSEVVELKFFDSKVEVLFWTTLELKKLPVLITSYADIYFTDIPRIIKAC